MYSLLILKESGDNMKYEDKSFLMDLKDYLDLPIERVNVYVKGKLEFTCYNFDRIFDFCDHIDYIDYELNIRLIIQDAFYSLELNFKRK